MRTTRVNEKTATRLAYGLMAWFLLSVVLAFFDDTYWPMAAMSGLAAGMWNGRLDEANATKNGNCLSRE